MKTNKFLTVLLSFIAVFAMTSCVEDDDYTVPSSLGDEENAALTQLLQTSTEVDVAYVKASYTGDDDIEQITNDIYVKGYVSSSDATGNFFKEFFIQDAPSNPTGALKIILNQVDSYNQFNQGREVYINLKGLYVGEERVGNGVITIGGGTETDTFGTTVTSLNDNQIDSNLLRSTMTAEMIPLPITFSLISNNNVGMFVGVDNVEFADDLNGQRYFDPTETFDTKRTMQACEGFDYVTFELETSSFSTFKEELLPITNGTIAGIVNKTFDGSQLILALNTTDDVNMNDSRCMPLDINDFTVVWEDGFDTGISNWTAQNIIGPGQSWGQTTFGNPAPSARMSGFSGGAQDNEDWLISPAIDMSTSTNGILLFETVKRFSGLDLEVFMSMDYAGGDPNTDGTWTPLAVALDTNIGSWTSWTNSGSIDVSAADGGNLFVAFKYTSNASDGAASFQVDNFKVLGL